MRRLGAFFLFKSLNYIILLLLLFFFIFYFFFWGGGGVRNIDILGGMKILWIFLGGSRQNWTSFRCFFYVF